MTRAINYEVERPGADATSVNHSSDEVGLVSGARAGNASAFGELFQLYERRIFGIAHEITRIARIRKMWCRSRSIAHSSN